MKTRIVSETTMGYFKSFIHGLNYEERPSLKSEPTFYDRNILGISFYHNMIIIEKGAEQRGHVMGSEEEVLPAESHYSSCAWMERELLLGRQSNLRIGGC